MKLHVVALFCALQLVSAERLNPRHHLLQQRQNNNSTNSPAPSASTLPGTPLPPPPATTQTTTSTTTTSGSTTSGSSTSGSSSSSTTSASTTSTRTGPPPLDTGTTIPPLANITSGMPTKAPATPTQMYKPGATPPISGAPVIPAPLKLGSWPPQDKVPDTSSPEVQAWLKELEGRDIPDFSPTADGSCVGDPAAAADAAKRGWWTCGGHTRDTDITACPDKLTWGVSFDDGPSGYTQTLLDYLDEKDVSATFFVVGSRVIERPNIVIEEYMKGHEISVHTWSHRPLTSLTTAQVVAELGWTRKAIKTVLGVTPTTMRPPYGDIDDRVRAISLAMGMIPIMWTNTPSGGKFDTNDWRVAGGQVNGTSSFQTFETILANASSLDTGFIVLQHDLFEITVDLAVGYTLNAALTHNPAFDLKPIGECSNIPQGNMYLETNKNTTFPAHVSAKGIDVDGNGTPDTSSGDGGAGMNQDNKTAGALAISTPVLATLSMLAFGVVGMLL